MTNKTEALKLALDVLTPDPEEAFWFVEKKKEKAVTAIREALADSALDRMAENARELGLDYEPPCKTGSQCTNKCQQCEQPAPVATPHKQQKPVAWPCVIAEADFEKDTITLEMQCSDYMVRAGQHWLSTSPPASKPWVGLTDKDQRALIEYANEAGLDDMKFIEDIEAKLKEKNNGN